MPKATLRVIMKKKLSDKSGVNQPETFELYVKHSHPELETALATLT